MFPAKYFNSINSFVCVGLIFLRSLDCHNIEADLATPSFCGYCRSQNSGIRLVSVQPGHPQLLGVLPESEQWYPSGVCAACPPPASGGISGVRTVVSVWCLCCLATPSFWGYCRSQNSGIRLVSVLPGHPQLLGVLPESEQWYPSGVCAAWPPPASGGIAGVRTVVSVWCLCCLATPSFWGYCRSQNSGIRLVSVLPGHPQLLGVLSESEQWYPSGVCAAWPPPASGGIAGVRTVVSVWCLCCLATPSFWGYCRSKNSGIRLVSVLPGHPQLLGVLPESEQWYPSGVCAAWPPPASGGIAGVRTVVSVWCLCCLAKRLQATFHQHSVPMSTLL